jgi:hypothetical protein
MSREADVARDSEDEIESPPPPDTTFPHPLGEGEVTRARGSHIKARDLI